MNQQEVTALIQAADKGEEEEEEDKKMPAKNNNIDDDKNFDAIFHSYFLENKDLTFDHIVDVTSAINQYEKDSGFRLVVKKSDGKYQRVYGCVSHIGCIFRAKFGKIRGYNKIGPKESYTVPYHCGPVTNTGQAGRSIKRRIKDTLSSSVEMVETVKDDKPKAKDVMKTAANMEGIDSIVPVCIPNLSRDGVTKPPKRSETRTAGRPKKVRLRKRSRFAHNPEESNVICSRCRQRGHNIRTCHIREALNKKNEGHTDGSQVEDSGAMDAGEHLQDLNLE